MFDKVPDEHPKANLCEWPNCDAVGKHKAPRSRKELNSFRWFCVDHIRIYNKSWNYYEGMSDKQVEEDLRNDTSWNRPSWPLKGNYKKVMDEINNFFTKEINNLNPNERESNYFRNKLIDENLTKDEFKALSTFNLELPLTLDKIKKTYKKLVKIFHPDVNGNDKKAEEKFKEINNSYKILLKKFKNDK